MAWEWRGDFNLAVSFAVISGGGFGCFGEVYIEQNKGEKMKDRETKPKSKWIFLDGELKRQAYNNQEEDLPLQVRLVQKTSRIITVNGIEQHQISVIQQDTTYNLIASNDHHYCDESECMLRLGVYSYSKNFDVPGEALEAK
jgi:hypothetical protein